MLAQKLAQEEERGLGADADADAPAPGLAPELVAEPPGWTPPLSSPESEFLNPSFKIKWGAFSSNGTRWHEMHRVVEPISAYKNATGVERTRLAVHAFVVNAITGGLKAPKSGMPGAWKSFSTGPSIAPELWDLFGVSLVGRDARTLGKLWRHMLSREANLDQGLSLPSAVIEPMLATPTRFLNTVEFLALRARKPRLLLEVLACRVLPSSTTDFDYASIAGPITTVAIAVLDAVFVPHSVEADYASWKAICVDEEERNALEDNVYYAAGWRAVALQLIDIASDGMPHRVEKKDASDTLRTVTVLELAVRCSEFDDFFFQRLMDDGLVCPHKYIEWSAVDLNAAFQASLDQSILIAPERQAKILGQLYGRLLLRWRNNPVARARKVVSGADDLARPWNRLLSFCSGCERADGVLDADEPPSADGGSPTLRHAADWTAVVDAMAAQHDAPDDGTDDDGTDAADWDRGSPLFASLMRSAMSTVVGQPTKTYMVAHVMQLAATVASVQMPVSQLTWLDIPRLVYNVALHHTELLPKLFKLMRLSENGTETPNLHDRHVAAAQRALLECVVNEQREASRQLVQALGPGNLPRSANPECHNLAIGGNVGFLVLQVVKLGQGAGTAKRNKYGPEFASFVNYQVEKDFAAVLDAMNWTAYEKEEALEMCTPKASKEGRPICARMLMARGTPPPDDSPYLQCIAANIFRPGEVGARAAQERFESALLGKRPAAEAEGDDARAKEARTSASE